MSVGLDTELGQFQDWLAAQGYARNTIRDRLTIVRAFAHALDSDPRDASIEAITSYLGRHGLARWTVATYYGHLSCWFTYLQAMGERDDNPLDAMTAPKSPKSKPRPLSEPEEERLVAAASPTMLAWLTLGFYQGFRAMEIAKVQGVEIDQHSTYVVGKGGRADILPTHPKVWAVARRYGSGYWFPTHGRGGHYQPETVSHVSSQFFTSLGIEGAIHRCRHTYATKLLRAGVNIRVVQTLMRHESLATTQRYTAVDEVELRDAVLRIDGA